MQNELLTAYAKKKIAIRYMLKGMSFYEPEFNLALKAMDIAETYHNGLRKDGVTPEFLHQLEIVGNILNFTRLFKHPARMVIVAFMHDVVEDYGQDAKIWDMESEKERLKGLEPFTIDKAKEIFGEEIAASIDSISKVVDGKKKRTEKYYKGLAFDMYGSIVKLEDRSNNLKSMLTVFTLEKQKRYAEDVVKYFMPMLKQAERNFPELSDVYQSLNNRLKVQIQDIFDKVEIFNNLGLSLDQIPTKVKQVESNKSTVPSL